MSTTLTETGTSQTEAASIRLVRELRHSATTTQQISVRNGWTAADSVYPNAVLLDALLDIRQALVTESADPGKIAIVEEALRVHGQRPGASTAHEVLALCDTIAGGGTAPR